MRSFHSKDLRATIIASVLSSLLIGATASVVFLTPNQAFTTGTDVSFDKPYYLNTDTATITVSGTECDTSPITADTVNVFVGSVDVDNNVVDKEDALTLTETGVNTGICVNTIPLSSSSTPINDGSLTVVDNGEIGAVIEGHIVIGFEAAALIQNAIRIDILDCIRPDTSFCTDPRWDIDTVQVAGRTTPGNHVDIFWGDGTVDSGVAITGSTLIGYSFGPVSHTYGPGAVGVNQIKANLIIPDPDPPFPDVILAQNVRNVNVERHATDIVINQLLDVPAGSGITAGGLLTDNEPELIGQQLPVGMPITFTDQSLSTVLPPTTTAGVTFSSGVEVDNCGPSCKGDEVASDDTPAHLLRLGVGQVITVPANTDSARMCMQNMADNLFEVKVTKPNTQSFIQSSFGAGDDIAIFELYSPLGMSSIEIQKVTDAGGIDIPGGTVNITCFETFNTAGSPQEQRRFGFDDLALGVYGSPLVLQTGSFFSTGPSFSTPHPDPLDVIAHFVGDSLYKPVDSSTVSYITTAPTIPANFGTGGEGTLVLSGDTGSGITKLSCGAPASTYDADGDGLCDQTWEASNGVITYSGTTYNLRGSHTVLPGSDKPDIYVEVDTMQGHALSSTVMNAVVTAFANKGIRLHLVQDETNLPLVDQLHVWSDSGSSDGNNNNDFDSIKKCHFGKPTTDRPATGCNLFTSNKLKAKGNAYHYLLVAHCMGGPSGIAEKPGNDMIVTLGCGFGPYRADGVTSDTSQFGTGTAQEIEGAIMHELGHNLNLDHGGNDGRNCKPNLHSVMSYTKEFPTYNGWRLDYSGKARTGADANHFLGNLDEDHLNENDGVLDAAGGHYPDSISIVYYSNGVARTASVAGGIDWSGNGGSLQGDIGARDLNTFPGLTGCDVAGADPTTVLAGYNEWSHLGYNFRLLALGLDGVHPTPSELPQEQLADMVRQQKLLADQYTILTPLKELGPNVFSLSKTSAIPVKILIKDEAGIVLKNANAKLLYQKDGTSTDVLAQSASTAASDSLFRWDTKGKFLIFNWDVSKLTPGTYFLKIFRNYDDPVLRSILDKNSDGITVTVILNA